MNSQVVIAATDGIKNQAFCFLATQTVPKMNKGKGLNANPFIGRIVKITKGNVMICSDYEKRVNNNLSKENKENDFVAQQNKVGNHVNKCVLFNENLNTYYLMYEWFTGVKKSITYLVDGKIEWTAEQFKENCKAWLPEIKAYENQGLERAVQVLSVKCENIKEFTVQKTNYRSK